MNDIKLIRQLLASVLDWQDAHASYAAAVKDFPPGLHGVRPAGLPHSGWEEIEHLRITQRDILDFCHAPTYHERRWPEEYWPSSPTPPSPAAWNESVAAFQADREVLKQIALNPNIDLTSVVPHGTDQTYLRELLVVADHNAYHVGQLILVRRALGVWTVA